MTADDAVEISIFPFHQGLAVLNAGIVDQDVEMAVFLDNVFQGLARDGGIAHIEGQGLRADGFCSRGKGCRIAGIDNDMGAIFLQGLGHGQAQPARGAGHQGNAIFQ